MQLFKDRSAAPSRLHKLACSGFAVMSSAFHRKLTARLITAFALLCAIAPVSVCFGQEAEATSPKQATAEHEPAGDEPPGHEVDHNQPPLSWQTDLAVFSLITFVLLLFVLRKVAWGPLIEGLDKREEGIRQAIAEAEESRRKAQALLADYEAKLQAAQQTVAEMIAEAKRDAERTSKDILAKAESDVDAIRVRATDEIAQAKDTALAEVFSSVNRQVVLATEHVLGRALSDGDQERLINEALQEVGQ
jgi:F-type H+-transporting ATPase subunit b